MKVSVEYAQEHLVDLLDTVRSGEEVEIANSCKDLYRLMLVRSGDAPTGQSRALGAGRGRMIVPSWEEWKAMDVEMEREIADAPLVSSGEI